MNKKSQTYLAKNLFLYFIAICIFQFSNAQETVDEDLPFNAIIQSTLKGKRYKFYGNTRLNFNQAYFSNWISGGESALTVLYSLDYNLNYSYRNGLVWDTNLLLSIGTTFISGSEFFKKADDRFEISSLVGKQINQFWNYSGLLKIKTQLLPGYRFYSEDGVQKRDQISQFFSPAFVQLSLGWYYKKTDDFSLNLSPLSGRLLLVSEKYTDKLSPGQKYFGVDTGKGSKFFFGASISGLYRKEIMQNIIWENKFSTYVNYLEKTKNIDFDWDMNFRFKVNNKVSGNFILHLLYDDDLISEMQVRELLGLGVNIDL